ncbi:MAG: aldolase/citrate lyase family protein [Leptonema sp. (in: bacteria)]
MIEKLQSALKELKDFGLYALKTGTEVEDMTFEEIQFLREISKGIVPLNVKIGGPEARNDIRFLLSIDTDCIIAPMIESPYALTNFIKTLDELKKQHQKETKAGINIETITGYMQLNAILNNPYAKSLTQITAARTDFSNSMGLDADHPKVIELCKEIIINCKKKGIETSIGGSIHSGIIESLSREIPSDFINTRHMVIVREILAKNPVPILKKHLEFEILLYEFLSSSKNPLRRKIHSERYHILRKRLL